MDAVALNLPSLTDGVAVLRGWQESDVPAMLRAFEDPWFQRFSDWAPRTTADAHAYLARREQGRQSGQEIDLAIASASSAGESILGGVSLNGVDLAQRRACVGYWLAPDARGKGTASRAVRLLARWAFTELDLARLELSCGPDNHASQRVAEHCGFTREGVLRSHLSFQGGRRDTVVFGLLPDELT